MHPGGGFGSGKRAAAGSSSIDALPDGVLEHILGFLLAPEAVRTCVLSRRWRHLWRSAPALRFGCLDGDGQVPPQVGEHRALVDRLLLLRGGGGPPLDTCDIRLAERVYDVDDDDLRRVNFWVWHAVAACKARSLRLHIDWEFFLYLDDMPLVSRHLTRLHLRGVCVRSSFFDFSGCPALEHLDLVTCSLYMPSKISSDSLKHLNLTRCLLSEEHRMGIHAPSLVSLRLDRNEGFTPMLDSMPSLLEAFVRMGELSADYCFKLCDEPFLQLQSCDCLFCVGSHGGGHKNCVLFKGLSEAKSLVLISAPSSSVSPQSLLILFKWELRWCPMFSKLKTLLLNEYWCMPDDFGPLVCILEHSPVLEELTLVFFPEGAKYKVEMKGSINPMERLATISEHLNTVKVKCQAVDERVLKVLKFLYTLNISFTS